MSVITSINTFTQVGACRVVSMSNIMGNYHNGISNNGLMAKLTLTTVGSLIIDGISLDVNDRVLLQNQSPGSQCGVYVVIDNGSPTTVAILQRAGDMQSIEQLTNGKFIPIAAGTQAGSIYSLVEPFPNRLGIDDINFIESASASGNYLPIAGGTMTGSLILAHDPTAPLEAATKEYVDNGNFLPLDGGTMTGPLILDGDPISTNEAANKNYVDDGLNTKLSLSGGTMTGHLFLDVNPTAPLQAATKNYVDTGLSAKLNLSGGSMSGYLVLNADPILPLGAATKQYVDNGGPTFPITPAQGGTGVINPTAHSVAISEGASNFNFVGLSNGQLLIGSNGSDPVPAVPTNGTNISWVGGAGTLRANLTGQVSPTNGGTGVSNPTAHGLMVAEGASAMTSLVLGNQQLPLGQTAGDPVATSLISGSNMDIEYSAGSITLNSSPYTVITVTDASTPINIPVDFDIFYLIEVAYGNSVTFNLPTTPSTRRQTLTFQSGTGGFIIAQGTVSGGQRTFYNGNQSTPGPGHGIQSGNNSAFYTDGIVMINYDLNNVTWIAFQPTGTPALF